MGNTVMRIKEKATAQEKMFANHISNIENI